MTSGAPDWAKLHDQIGRRAASADLRDTPTLPVPRWSSSSPQALPKLTMRIDAGPPPHIRAVGSTCSSGPAMISAVTDDPLPADLDHIRVVLERTHVVGRRLIGLHVDDARKLATQSHCHFRVVTNPIMTAELDMRRVNVRTEDDIVVDVSTG